MTATTEAHEFPCPSWCETGWESGHHDGDQTVAHVLPIGDDHDVWLWANEDRTEASATFTAVTIGLGSGGDVTASEARRLAAGLLLAADRLDQLAADGVAVTL